MNYAIRAAMPLLTNCLSKVYPVSALDALHVSLMSTLSTHLTPTWTPTQPSRGSSMRSLLISPQIAAPQPFVAAANAAGVSCRDWVLLLTQGDACEIFIDPGMVSFRVGSNAEPTVYWQYKSRTASVAKRLPWDIIPTATPAPKVSIVESPVDEPLWMTNLLSKFPATPKSSVYSSTSPIRRPTRSIGSSSDRSVSPVSASEPARYVPPHRLQTSFTHARSPSELSASAVSFVSSASSSSSMYSDLSMSMSQLSVSSADSASSTRSSSPVEVLVDDCQVYDYELEEECNAVYVDASRTAVVEYECGKVGVLGGAVMLGVPKSASSVRPSAYSPQRTANY